MTLLSSVAVLSGAAAELPLWRADAGDGTYRNPVLYADYSDPDAIRVDNDYWMVASSFNHVPGLPILHSRDLVNWSLVGHALPRLVPEDVFATPQHGKGVWAPSIRYHDGRYWIYYPDPDFGLYLITATDPRGPWTHPVLVKAGRGLIDPCPLWDDDGQLYLVHGWARSRAGFANRLTLLRLSADGAQVAEDLGTLIDGDQFPGYTTLEGPKFYKRDGWYYVFAPAGGVKNGWQSVFRSRSLLGPYEARIVLAQGRTPINGPHQGALVNTPSGEEWFLHFQDRDAYGRIVHLQPVAWKDGWPVLGADPDGDGTGEPVLAFRSPKSFSLGGDSARTSSFSKPADSVDSIPTSDEFDAPRLGVQWQWQANPRDDWHSLSARPGFLRLTARSVVGGNLFSASHLLLQKFPAPSFSVTTKLDAEVPAGVSAGLVVFGFDYAWVGLREGRLAWVAAENANDKPSFQERSASDTVRGPVYLRATVADGAICRFAYSLDGSTFMPIGEAFRARPGRWVGAKIGLFAAGEPSAHADFDWVRFEPITR